MTGLDLEHDFYAHMGRAMRQSDINNLLARNITPMAQTMPDMMIAAQVHLHAPGRFCLPQDMRVPAELTGVFLFLCRDEAGDAIDVASWRPSDGAVATMHGVAWCIGEDLLCEPYHVLREDMALAVFRSPLSWLQAERCGICILDYRRASYALRDHYPVLAEDFAHATDLDKALTIRPRILLPSIDDRIAA